MADTSYLDWPFFEPRHKDLARSLRAWCETHLTGHHGSADEACRAHVAKLGAAGWLQHTAAGDGEKLDVRTLA